QKKADGHFILDGKVLISEVNDLLGTSLDEQDVDTIGGWFLTQKFDVHKGDSIENDGFVFQINEIEGHHILYIEVYKAKTEQKKVEVAPE
ncbi:transporter associated domain-containing protein, partial [Neobacillus drentensis]